MFLSHPLVVSGIDSHVILYFYINRYLMLLLIEKGTQSQRNSVAFPGPPHSTLPGRTPHSPPPCAITAHTGVKVYPAAQTPASGRWCPVRDISTPRLSTGTAVLIIFRSHDWQVKGTGHRVAGCGDPASLLCVVQTLAVSFTSLTAVSLVLAFLLPGWLPTQQSEDSVCPSS